MAAKLGGAAMERPDLRAADRGDLPGRAGNNELPRMGSRSGSAGMPDSTPMTKLYRGGPANMPFLAYMPTQRTMPTSKHSNSGCVPVSRITSR
jgi:hypothetical protein